MEVTDVPVVWFNDQYNGTIAPNQVVFIEFPERQPVDSPTKDMQRITLPIRLHIVSRVMTKPDMEIADAEIIAHEKLATDMRDELRGSTLNDIEGEAISTRLIWRGWQHFHRYQGWMVTWVDLDCKVVV